MRLLILGGTAWLGRHIALAAMADGHEVTCLARGESGATPVGARFVRGDRTNDDALTALDGEYFDTVVDVARQPGQVRAAVDSLDADRYVFVSSCSVYADQSQPGMSEDDAVLEPLDVDVMADQADYGRAKSACEQAVLDRFGTDRALVVRPGLIGGPGDPSGRSTYWPWRFAHPSNPGGRVLVPDEPDAPTQLVDVRDLASWTVRAAAGGLGGIFNAVGEIVTLGRHLETADRVAGRDSTMCPVPSGWLVERGVQEWAGVRSLPLWLVDPDFAGFCARDGSAARAAGFATRPLESTLADALAGLEEAPTGAGLTDREESELLSSR